jgi:CheY-like chemotaxis protein
MFRRAGFSVLVVDDDPEMVESTATLLQLHGFRVNATTDCDEALAIAATDPPAVALIDLVMPRMGGYELARRLRGLMPDGPLLLVAVTGYFREEDQSKAAAAGFGLQLLKPVKPGVLVELIRDCEAAFRAGPALVG